MTDKLTLTYPGGASQSWDLDRRSKYTIGNSRGAKIYIRLPGIDAEHAKLRFSAQVDAWVLTNLDGEDGTIVEGEPLAPRDRAPLFNEAFALAEPGRYEFRIQRDQKPAELML